MVVVDSSLEREEALVVAVGVAVIFSGRSFEDLIRHLRVRLHREISDHIRVVRQRLELPYLSERLIIVLPGLRDVQHQTPSVVVPEEHGVLVQQLAKIGLIYKFI